MSAADSVNVGAFLASQGLINIGQFTGLALGPGMTAMAQGNNLFLDQAPSGNDLPPVSNLAGLTASTDNFNGALRVVDTLLQPFQLDLTSTATVDGISVVATSDGVGRWLRVLTIVPHWSNQLNWEYDSVAGNDENSGIFGSGAPLKTCREFSRRVRIANSGNVTYTVNGNAIPLTDLLRFSPQFGSEGAGNGSAIVLFKGITTNAVSSAFTATSASVPAANTQATVTDPLDPWAAHLGELVTVTSGAASGAVAQILLAPGAGVARVSNWVFPANGVFSATPAPADTYVIKTLPVASVAPGGQGMLSRVSIRMQDYQIAAPGGVGLVGDMQFIGCRSLNTTFFPVASQVNFTFFLGCAMDFTVPSVLMSYTDAEGIQFFGGGFRNCILDASLLGGYVFRSVFQSSRVRQSAGSNVKAGDVIITTPTGFFDLPAGVPAIELTRGMTLVIQGSAGATGLYGTGITGTYGVVCREGSQAIIPTACTPTLTGPSGDLLFDGMATAFQQLELSSGALAAAVVVPLTTWADYVAPVVLNVSGFNRNVVSYKSGARMIAAS